MDRRTDQRFKMDNACIVHHDKTVGTIIDLSVGGVSCICLEQGFCAKGDVKKINIYCNKLELCAEDLSMKVLESGTDEGMFDDKIRARKCRIQFVGLEEPQEDQLVRIIVRSEMK